MAQMALLREKAKEMDPLLQPNSAIMGLNMIPKEYRAPELKKSMPKQAARTYQPQWSWGLKSFFLEDIFHTDSP